ncbi:MAG: hypothetical protein EPN25_07000 [Nitrospirae bacterium]|nr:MAG: hypothetical protein EPN25_07000 [Nitrospirota bacterium]
MVSSSGPVKGVLSLLSVLIVVALFFMPFLNKAFHIDDVAFMNISGMMDHNPLHAVPVDYPYMGKLVPGFTPYELTHPLLIPYFIKLVSAVFGASEIALHAAFLIFPVILLLALLKLNALLFSDAANRIVLVLFASMPAFLVNGQTLMTDVPMTAFLILSVVAFYTGLEDSPGKLIGASGALVAALFVSYQSLLFFPLFFYYAWLRRRLDLRVVLSLLVPVLLLLLWFFLVYRHHGLLPLIRTRIGGAGADILSEIRRGALLQVMVGKAVFTVSALGGSAAFVMVYYHVISGSVRRFSAEIAGLTLLFFLLVMQTVAYPAAGKILLAALAALGVLSIREVVRVCRRSSGPAEGPQTLFLTAWFFTVLAYDLLLMPFGAVRYLLPALPPLLLLLLNGPLHGAAAVKRPVFTAAVLILSAAFGLASAVSDYHYAKVYREFAEEVKTFRQARAGSVTIWYIGEWGMRFYMDRAGAHYLFEMSEEPKKGDFVVTPEMPRQWLPSLQVQSRLLLYATRNYDPVLPLQLFNSQAHAGFYGHFWGLLPFSFSPAPCESFKIWEVRY